jgi:transposase, IS30 family
VSWPRRGVRLYSGRTRRKPRAQLGKCPGPIVGMRSIEDRPAEAEDRKVPGHGEGDLIIGAAGASAAATLVERTTRFTVILALQDGKNADGLAQVLIGTVASGPAPFKASLTWGQGGEQARHAKVTLATGMPIYFAHPHSPWERGTNENTNRIIRRHLPKSTEITSHQPYLDAIADETNDVPRKTLNWRPPREAYETLLATTATSPS